jgi:hypothetical protein
VKPPRVDVRLIVVLLYLTAKLLLSVSSPMLARTLWLSGVGTEPLDFRPPLLGGEKPPRPGVLR